MTLVRTRLIGISDSGNVQSYDLGSASPSANALLILHVLLTDTVAPAVLVASDINAWGLTWTKVEDVVSTANVGALQQRISTFWAVTTSAPGADGVAVDASGGAGGNQTSCFIWVTEYTGHNGYVQSAVNNDNSDTAATWNVSLDVAPSPSSIVEAFVSFQGAVTGVIGGDTGWVGDTADTETLPNTVVNSFSKQNDQSATGTWNAAGGDSYAASIVEIAAALAPPFEPRNFQNVMLRR